MRIKLVLVFLLSFISIQIFSQSSNNLQTRLERNIFYLNKTYFNNSTKRKENRKRLFGKKFNYKRLVRSINFETIKIDFLDTIEVQFYYEMERMRNCWMLDCNQLEMSSMLKNHLNKKVNIATNFEKKCLLSSLHIPAYFFITNSFNGDFNNLQEKMTEFLNLGPIGEILFVKIVERLNNAFGINIYDNQQDTFVGVKEASYAVKDNYLKSILNEIREENSEIKRIKTNLTLFGRKNNIQLNNLLIDDLIIVDFWASWCGPCIEAFPKMDQLLDLSENKPKVICIAYNDKKKVEAKMSKIADYKNIQLYYCDEEEVLQENIKIIAYPSYLIIDKSGLVVSKIYHSFEQVYKEWNNLIRAN